VRQYATDSPEATARIVALTLMADGAIDLSETEALQRHEIISKLGLESSLFDRVVHEFCEDMMAFAYRATSNRHELDSVSINALLNEIRDADKQNMLLSSMFNIVNAEGTILPGESALIAQALRVWRLDNRTASDSPEPIHNRLRRTKRANAAKITA